ncbi:GEVED domain-containing protein [Nonlabens sp. Asnod3-A02]|uniref:GEVED domain-containing protein n=1 Tax=Nonlabens sp. Asnod3-A02 TaxID=3160579 RepID=UPI003869C61F
MKALYLTTITSINHCFNLEKRFRTFNNILNYLLLDIKTTVIAVATLLICSNTMYSQCVPTGMQDFNNFNITNFQVTGDAASQINNNTGADNSTYSDFTNQVLNVTGGTSYNFSLDHVKESWGNLKVVAWIDYGANGTFVQVFDSGAYINNNAGTATTNGSFTVALAAPSGPSILRIAASYCSTCGGGASIDASGCSFTGRAEVEDYTLNVAVSPNVSATDDELNVLLNSSGASNRIDVGLNDNIGTVNGSSGDDYSLITATPTTNGGTIIEITDGIFEYNPAVNFIGTDSFDYQICDAGSICESATVYITVNTGACVPTSNSNARTGNEVHYITRVQVSGESQNIDNTSGDDGGYGNYIDVPPADMIPGNSYTIDLDVFNNGSNNSGWAAFIDFNGNGDFNDAGDNVYATNGTGGTEASPYAVRTITIPTSAVTGKTVLRIGSRRYWASVESCGTTDTGFGLQSEEFEDYVIDILPVAGANISLSGNAVAIAYNSTTTTLADGTNYGVVDSNIGDDVHTFVITNNGSSDLTLGLVGPITFGTGSHSSFTLENTPVPGTILIPGATETFQIRYTPRTIGQHNGTIEISSDDSNENPFIFAIQGEGAQIYPDTDGDGVPDNVDVDDDNDGIRDVDEQNACLLSPLSTTADVIFLNETFGAGTNRVTIDGSTAGVTTTYCYEDGTIVQGPNECDTEVNLGDGNYTVHYSISDNNGSTNIGPFGPDVSTWSEDVWYYGEDHTVGDVNGRMAIFNADVDPGVFYETEIVGTVPGAPIFYEFWALNIDRQDSDFPGTELPRILPNVTVNFFNSDKSVLLDSYNAGDVERCTDGSHNGCGSLSQWIQFNTTVTLADSDFIIQMVNNSPGGLGNDLALDDIKITQTLCDLDGDGVADVIDLDNDNDGIPNVYEIGQPAGLAVLDSDEDGTTLEVVWVDVDGNGLHDAYETYTPRDSDGDGVPDYLDLDSDNDGIFDVLEYDGLGDLDVNGDGIGEGTDAISGVDTDEFDGDGLLGTIDDNDDDADGEDHGTMNFVLPLDTDNDGLPDYIDVDSNDNLNDLSNGSDIDNSYYAGQDGDGDGRVDGSVDTDRDGVYDGNNDFDTGIYGAPIDLDDDLSIFFDGRNDYLQTPAPVTAGLSSSTIMAWALAENTGTNVTVMGEENFNISLDSASRVIVTAIDAGGNTYTVSSPGTISNTKWVNISATYTATDLKLFINGVEEATIATAGAALSNASGSPFTVGNSATAGSSNYYRGFLDEIRVFNKGIDIADVRRLMYQEIEANGTLVTGKILPKNTSVLWNDIAVYYDFASIEGDIVFDAASNTDIRMYNVKKIVPQTAPIPYVTAQDGLLSDNATFVQTVVWDPADIENYDYTIIKVGHETTLDVSISTVGVVVDAAASIMVEDGNYLENEWYVILNGLIDLEGDAQLVQTIDSDLDVSSAGRLKRWQEGKSDVFSYNYWSSPVGVENTTSNNNTFNLGMLQDADGFINITGVGVRTPPVTIPTTISGRWLHTFNNGVSYADWFRIDGTSPIDAGHGWSQKGAGAVGDQEYLFEGKPNNGSINITAIDTDGDPAVDLTTSLLGNPYPSAIDARTFIDDNASVIDGAVYLWDQFGSTDHILANYEGGYATITKMATVNATQIAGSGALGGTTVGTVVPTFFLPVSQGFFVTLTDNGTLNFNNGQRVFKQESLGESIFVSAPGSPQPTADRSDYQDETIDILRLELEADNGASKEIVLGFADFLTDGVDYGYDGAMFEALRDTDMYTSYNGKNFVIRSFDQITPSKVVPLTVHGISTVNYKISAKEIANISASQELYLRDNETNTYHDLRNGEYYFTLSADGKNSSRFEIVFEQRTLGLDEETLEQIDIYYLNNDGKIYVDHLQESVSAMNVYDLSGKSLFSFRESELTNIQNGIYIPQVSSGIYLVEIDVKGTKKSVKIIVN